MTFSKRFLGIVGSLTGCRVELEPDGTTVTAKGENIEEINRAMSKLDVVDRWAVRLIILAKSVIANDAGGKTIMLPSRV